MSAPLDPRVKGLEAVGNNSPVVNDWDRPAGFTDAVARRILPDFGLQPGFSRSLIHDPPPGLTRPAAVPLRWETR